MAVVRPQAGLFPDATKVRVYRADAEAARARSRSEVPLASAVAYGYVEFGQVEFKLAPGEYVLVGEVDGSQRSVAFSEKAAS